MDKINLHGDCLELMKEYTSIKVLIDFTFAVRMVNF